VTSLRLEAERLAGSGSLTDALLRGSKPARELFPPDAFELPHVGRGRLPSGEPSPLPIEAFHPAGAEAHQRLQAVLRGEGLVISTGQQPQLFGGPLYVLYKALTAVHAAVELEDALGLPCLAVFWVASDDHDWQEVASVNLLDADEDLRQLDVSPPSGWEGRSVGPAPLPAGVRELGRSLCDILRPTADGREWVDRAARVYVPGTAFSEAFVRTVSDWLGDLPVAFLDSAHPKLREASRPAFHEVLGRHAEVLAALYRGFALVHEMGFAPQLAFLEGASPLFRDGPDGRQRLHVEGRWVRPGGAGDAIELDEVQREIDATPERFSPAAALRPVLESRLLPVAGTVLGPAEIAYWAQLEPLFRTLEVRMPRVRPRSSWRVVEPKVDRLLQRTGLSAAEVQDGGQGATRDLVERNRPAALDEAIRDLERSLQDGFARIEAAADREVPGLRSAAGKLHSQVGSAVDGFRKTLDSRVREREHILLDQVRRVVRNLYPGGMPQERAVSPLVYLSRYGHEFLDIVRAGHSL